MPTESPWRIRQFRTLFSSNVLSVMGSNVSYVAVPMVAVVALDAGPGQVGLLAALSTIAFLLIGLPAGAWVDRMRHRRVLIVAELSRGALLGSVPLAWWLDTLTFGHLCAVVLLDGVSTVFFDVTAQSTLPKLVGREALVPANAALVSLSAAGNVTGRGAGGGLVELLTAPLAMAVSAVGYLASGLQLLRLKPMDDGASAKAVQQVRLLTQIGEGLRHVLRDGELRALALTGTLGNLGSVIINTMLPVLFARELGLSTGLLGLYWAIGGIGIFVGARCAQPLAARFGLGRTMVRLNQWVAPVAVFLPLIDRGAWLWLAAGAWSVFTFKTGVANVLGVSLRQRLTPGPLLGRMNATFRFMFTGSMAIGASLSGLIGEYVSLRAALWTGAVCLALSVLPVALSPIRHRTALPDADYEPVRSQPRRSLREPNCVSSRLR
ncbi:MFS transporter [Streptomyces sp. TRM66268-LWL]|uniref:MFS transporter n=2 Tax=Streptomyces polyasparticus TaxID=2767826 RepID=A0ABR7SD46_9ACTN|nr:MFS transporter [Streptomyces polyasparticus]MBC9713406.1 MFS transporter [Streptomyces polyasparticus]